jgi:multiple sugar transport system substrate-binding protein
LPILAFNFTKYPNAAKAFVAFMLEKENFDKWLSGARGYLTHTLNAYDSAPVWTADPKNQVFSQASKRALPASGIGTPARRRRPRSPTSSWSTCSPTTARAQGRQERDRGRERQLKRIYR